MINSLFIPGDADIRFALHSSIHAANGDTVIIDELGLCRGKVRVDVAAIDVVLHGYEIKSDRDSLRRLGVQVELYSKTCDRATLVIGERHLARALKIVPAWWGILKTEVFGEDLRFMTLRKGRKNPQRDPRALVELLWLDDAIALLEERGVSRGIRGKPRRVVWDRVCQHFSEDEIAENVRNHLKTRVERQVPPQLW